MTRTLLARLSAGTLLLAGCWIAFTQTQTQAPRLTMNKVKDDLYMIEGGGGNVAVYVTSEGAILVDDKFEQDHEAIVTLVKSVTPLPVKYVMSTHYHSDHTGGNAKFLPTAEIISTANARAAIVNHLQPDGPVGLAPARVTFTEESAVYLGGKEVRARYFGRGHTNGDAVVYFPALRTIHTGDLMAGTSPLIDYSGGGSAADWPKTLDAVLKLDFDTVIPGHGPVTDKAGLLNYRNNVEKLRARVAGLLRDGKAQDDVSKVLAAEFGWNPTSMQMKWGLPGMMKELK